MKPSSARAPRNRTLTLAEDDVQRLRPRLGILDRPVGVVISGDVDADHLVMSHLSSNYDRTGFQQDANVVFPIDRLHELATDGVIGSVANYHYAFMGAARLPGLEPKARQVAGLLKRDAVDAVLLTPV